MNSALLSDNNKQAGYVIMEAVPIVLFFTFHRHLLMFSLSNILISQAQDQQSLRRLGNSEVGTQTLLLYDTYLYYTALPAYPSCTLATTFSCLEVSGVFQGSAMAFLVGGCHDLYRLCFSASLCDDKWSVILKGYWEEQEPPEGWA